MLYISGFKLDLAHVKLTGPRSGHRRRKHPHALLTCLATPLAAHGRNFPNRFLFSSSSHHSCEFSRFFLGSSTSARTRHVSKDVRS